ncbi:MAG: hypothetical protein CVV64_14470 [Candidatus Wallbacteria bacterium HGW-Wallbacteria-1]|jgi:DNA repair exonuclease SbcCD ATPase subunit|uniref:Uncharacterized protein n=1 Tax=Candidatus Wallbacteria bacterium HGW-Wallbacteria-1 TaxID=2013854 RepID=A0A2N1PM30_9BACT|nr:MAG: hypothetical protein CVV64_14470 [Candidatus Wallbacteria bacterium HGW-Wallbacteria-1]
MDKRRIAEFNKSIMELKKQGFEIREIEIALDNEQDNVAELLDDAREKATELLRLKDRLYHLKTPSNEFMVSAIDAKTNSLEEFDHVIESVSRLEESMDADSPENIRSRYMQDAVKWGTQGYDISQIQDLKDGDVPELVDAVRKAGAGIRKLSVLRERLDKLTFKSLRDDVLEILKDFRNPLKANEVEQKIITLESFVELGAKAFEAELPAYAEKGYEIAELEGIGELDFDTAYGKFSKFRNRVEAFEEMKGSLEHLKAEPFGDLIAEFTGQLQSYANFDKATELHHKLRQEIITHRIEMAERVEEWKEEGWNVSVFSQIHSLDLDGFIETYEKYAQNLASAKELRKELEAMQTPGFQELWQETSQTLNNPWKIDDARTQIEVLKENMEQKLHQFLGEMIKWKTEGFDVSILESADKSDVPGTLKLFEDTVKNIALVDEVRARLDTLDRSTHADKIAMIESKLSDPSFVHEAFKLIESLQTSAADRRKSIVEGITQYAEQGFEVDDIKSLSDSRLEILEERFSQLSTNIETLKAIESRLNEMDFTPEMDSSIQEIRSAIRIPSRAQETAAKFAALQNLSREICERINSRIRDLTRLGYITDSLRGQDMEKGPGTLTLELKKFESLIPGIQDARDKLEVLDTSLFPEKKGQITELLRNPLLLNTALQELGELEAQITENGVALHERVKKHSRNGLNVDPLLRLTGAPQSELSELLDEFDRCLEKIDSLRGHLEELDCDHFTSQRVEVEAALLRPLQYEKAADLISSLEQKVKNKRISIESKIRELKARGFDTTPIDPYLSSRLSVLIVQWETYFDKISILMDVEKELDSLDLSLFSVEAQRIRNILRRTGGEVEGRHALSRLKRRIEQTSRSIVSQIENYRELGYDTQCIAQLPELNLSEAMAGLEKFEKAIERLEEMRSRYLLLDRRNFIQNCEAIDSLLERPEAIDELEMAIMALESKIAAEESIFMEFLESSRRDGWNVQSLENGREGDLSTRIRAREIFIEKTKILVALRDRIFEMDSSTCYDQICTLMEQTWDPRLTDTIQKDVDELEASLEREKDAVKNRIMSLWDEGFDVTSLTALYDNSLGELQKAVDSFESGLEPARNLIRQIHRTDTSLHRREAEQIQSLLRDPANIADAAGQFENLKRLISDEWSRLELRISEFESIGLDTSMLSGIKTLPLEHATNLIHKFESLLLRGAEMEKELNDRDLSPFSDEVRRMSLLLKAPHLYYEAGELLRKVTAEARQIEENINSTVAQAGQEGWNIEPLRALIGTRPLAEIQKAVHRFRTGCQALIELRIKAANLKCTTFAKDFSKIEHFFSNPWDYEEAHKLMETLEGKIEKAHSRWKQEVETISANGWNTSRLVSLEKCGIDQKVEALKFFTATLPSCIEAIKKLNAMDISLFPEAGAEIRDLLRDPWELKNGIALLEKTACEILKRKEILNSRVAALAERGFQIALLNDRIHGLSLEKAISEVNVFEMNASRILELKRQVMAADYGVFEDDLTQFIQLSEDPSYLSELEEIAAKLKKAAQDKAQAFEKFTETMQDQGYDTSDLELSRSAGLKGMAESMFQFELLLPRVRVNSDRLEHLDTSAFMEEAENIREMLKNPFKLDQALLRVDAMESIVSALENDISKKVTEFDKNGFTTITLRKELKKLNQAESIQYLNRFSDEILLTRKLISNLTELDTSEFHDEAEEIRIMLTDPGKNTEAGRLIENLAEKIESLWVEWENNIDAISASGLDNKSIKALIRKIPQTMFRAAQATYDKRVILLEELKEELSSIDCTLFADELQRVAASLKNPENHEEVRREILKLRELSESMSLELEIAIDDLEADGFIVGSLREAQKSLNHRELKELIIEFTSQCEGAIALREQIRALSCRALSAEVGPLLRLAMDPTAKEKVDRGIVRLQNLRDEHILSFEAKAAELSRRKFDTEPLMKLIQDAHQGNADPDDVDDYFNDFELKVQKCSVLSQRLSEGQSLIFSSEVMEIKVLLTKPWLIDEAERRVEELEKKSEEKRCELVSELKGLADGNLFLTAIQEISDVDLDTLVRRRDDAIAARGEYEKIVNGYEVVATYLENWIREPFETLLRSRATIEEVTAEFDKLKAKADARKREILADLRVMREKGYTFPQPEDTHFADAKKLQEFCRQKMAEIESLITLGMAAKNLDLSLFPTERKELDDLLFDTENLPAAEAQLAVLKRLQEQAGAELDNRVRIYESHGYNVKSLIPQSGMKLEERKTLIDSFAQLVEYMESLSGRFDDPDLSFYEKDVRELRRLTCDVDLVFEAEEGLERLQNKARQKRESILEMVESWSQLGYTVSSVLKNREKSLPVLWQCYETFLQNLNSLEILREKLRSLDEGLFPEMVRSIASKLQDVEAISEIENELTALEQANQKSREMAIEKTRVFEKDNFDTSGLLRIIHERIGKFEEAFEDFSARAEGVRNLRSKLDSLDHEIFPELRDRCLNLSRDVNSLDSARKALSDLEMVINSRRESILKSISEYRETGYELPETMDIIYDQTASLKSVVEEFSRTEEIISSLKNIDSKLSKTDTSLWPGEHDKIKSMLLDYRNLAKATKLLEETGKKAELTREKFYVVINRYIEEGFIFSEFTNSDSKNLASINLDIRNFEEALQEIQHLRERLNPYLDYPDERDEAQSLINAIADVDRLQEIKDRILDFETRAKGLYFRRIENYSTQGLSVGRLEAAMELDPPRIREIFKTFESDLSTIESAIEYLNSLPGNLYTEERLLVKGLANNPSAASRIKKVVEKVRKAEHERVETVARPILEWREMGIDVRSFENYADRKPEELEIDIQKFSKKVEKLLNLKSEYLAMKASEISIEFEDLGDTLNSVANMDYLEPAILAMKSDMSRVLAEKVSDLRNQGYDTRLFDAFSGDGIGSLLEAYDDFMTRVATLESLEKELNLFVHDLSEEGDYLMAKAELKNPMALEFIKESIVSLSSLRDERARAMAKAAAERAELIAEQNKAERLAREAAEKEELAALEQEKAEREKEEELKRAAEEKVALEMKIQEKSAEISAGQGTASATGASATATGASATAKADSVSEAGSIASDSVSAGTVSTDSPSVTAASSAESADDTGKSSEVTEPAPPPKPKIPTMSEEMRKKFEEWKRQEEERRKNE